MAVSIIFLYLQKSKGTQVHKTRSIDNICYSRHTDQTVAYVLHKFYSHNYRYCLHTV